MHIFHKWVQKQVIKYDVSYYYPLFKTTSPTSQEIGGIGYECSVCFRRKVVFENKGRQCADLVQLAMQWVNKDLNNLYQQRIPPQIPGIEGSITKLL